MLTNAELATLAAAKAEEDGLALAQVVTALESMV